MYIKEEGFYVIKCNFACTFARNEREVFQLCNFPESKDVSLDINFLV